MSGYTTQHQRRAGGREVFNEPIRQPAPQASRWIPLQFIVQDSGLVVYIVVPFGTYTLYLTHSHWKLASGHIAECFLKIHKIPALQASGVFLLLSSGMREVRGRASTHQTGNLLLLCKLKTKQHSRAADGHVGTNQCHNKTTTGQPGSASEKTLLRPRTLEDTPESRNQSRVATEFRSNHRP